MATLSLAGDKVSITGNITRSKRKVFTSAEAGNMTMPRTSKHIIQPTQKVVAFRSKSDCGWCFNKEFSSIQMQEQIF